MSESDVSASGRGPEGSREPGWAEERLALSSLDYPIPKRANHWTYMLGGLTAFFIAVLVLTGLYLGQFYNPSPAGAHDSVLYLISRAPFGDWIRSLHYWAAGATVITITAHLGYVFWRRAYRRPREVTWWVGVGLADSSFSCWSRAPRFATIRKGWRRWHTSSPAVS